MIVCKMLAAGAFALAFCAPSGSTLSYAPAPDSPYYVGPMVGRPVLGDVDRDGDLDVVVACGTCCGSRPDERSGHVYVLLGDGKGRFDDAPGSPIKVASSVRKVALGDVNRDGILDVAAAEHDSYGLTLLLGDGKGGFQPAPGSPFQSASGGRPHTHDIAIADVDGNGAPDLLSTNANDGTISVLLGDGRGAFRPAPGSPARAARHPYDAIAVADFDADGRVDLAIPDLRANGVVILRGDGKGGFTPGVVVSVGERPGYVAAGDFDRDGDVDLCATHDDVGRVDVLLGDGRGNFALASGSPVRVDRPVWGVVAADLDGDRDLDLALGAADRGGPVVLLGDGKGAFAPAPLPPLDGGAMPSYVAVGDLDGDRRPDLVTGNYGSGDVSVFLRK